MTGSTGGTGIEQFDRLLTDYRPGSFFFSSRHGALLGAGVRAAFDGDAENLSTDVPKLLADSGGDVALGALPFDPSAAPRLVVPDTVRRAAPSTTRPAAVPTMTTVRSMRSLPSPERHKAAVADAVRALRADELSKVVLARSLELRTATPVDVAAALRNLCARDPHANVFAMDLGPGVRGPYRTLLGASPELLVRKEGRRINCGPLAGTMPRSADPATDRQRADRLRASRKDRREHAVVIETMTDVLNPLCTRLTVGEPELMATEAVWHLGTRIEGDLSDEDTTVLDVARALHPTPAVCGAPVSRARLAIDELECFDRGYYAGAVGWMDSSGDGEWAVTLRCGEVDADEVWLCAGGGIVAGSDPAAELDETTAKFRTLLAAIGVDDIAAGETGGGAECVRRS